MRALLLCASLLLLAGCTSAPEESGPLLGKLTAAQVTQSAEELVEVRGFTAAERRALLSRLRAYLADEAPLLGNPGVQGVGAFDAASGGFLIKGTLGKGHLRLGPGAPLQRFTASGVTVGAVVGGKSSRGLFLIVGLSAESLLAGNYGFHAAGATVGDQNDRVRLADAEPRQGAHILRFFSLSTGVSADAGRGGFALELKPGPTTSE